MKRLIIALMFLLISVSPVLAMEKMSMEDLKKITAQIASTAGHAADGASPGGDIYEYGGNLYGGYTHADSLQPVTTGAVDVVQTATEPGRVLNIVSDANDFKSGVSLGFF